MTSRRSHPRYVCGASFLTLAVGVFGASEGLAAESNPADADRPGLGVTKETAIEVCGPNGEHAYFDRLLCPDGSPVNYERIQNEGFRNAATSKADQEALRVQMLTSAPIPAGQKDFHMIGRFSVDCAGGRSILFVDRYHCPDPKDQGPPPWFSFTKDRGSSPPATAPGERGLGLVKTTAVEVCGPQGETDYLDRLRCADGGVVRFKRTGSMGLRNDPTSTEEDDAARKQVMSAGPIPAGQRDFHLVDGYSAACHEQTTFLYLDPYHCPDPKNQGSPPGFSLSAGRKVR